MKLRASALFVAMVVAGLGWQQLGQVRPFPAWASFLAVPTTTALHSGDNLQTAINNAVAGDTLVLDAGAEFVGTFSLPAKIGSSYITLKSSALASLPAGTRVSPSSVTYMARIRTNVNNGPALYTNGVAHNYRFQGLEITTTAANASDGGIIRLGSNPKETALSQITYGFDFDRCYVHGQSTQNVQQGFVINAQDATVQNSYVSDVHYIGTDSQAILSYNSPGGIHILNNHLEAAGENILVGGADPGISGLVPGVTGGIEIVRNTLYKPLSWKVGDPSYAGIHWTVKNLLELKNAMNVTIDGNILTNNWTDGQTGVPVLFTVRNQGCTAPWSTIQNVTFTNNTVSGARGGINLLGKDNEAEASYGRCTNPATQGSVRATGLTVSNNLFYNNTGEPFLTMNGYYSVTFDHNTDIPNSGNTMTLYGQQSTGFVFKNNMVVETQYGIFGDGGVLGTAALAAWTPSYTFTKNVLVATQNQNPSGTCGTTTCYPASVSTVQFVNYAGGNYALQTSSPYHNAGTDGADIGVNMTALLAAQGGTAPTPTPTPTPTVAITGATTLSGAALNGVSVRLLKAADRTLITSATSASGVYSLTATSGTSVIVSPFLEGYTFNPSEVLFSTIATAKSQNFAASAISTPTPTPTPLPTPTPTPTPSVSPSPTPNVCGPNQLISSGCTCLTKVVGPPSARRCRP